MKTRQYPETLLIIDDERDFVTLTSALLERAGYDCFGAADLHEARARLKTEFIDLILIDQRLRHETGTEFLKETLAKNPGPAGIVISAHADLEMARLAMSAGASDILPKPFEEAELLETVRRVLDRTAAARDALRHRWNAARAARPPEIVGESAAIRGVLDLVRRISASSSTVLIQGESGCGKELIAKAIHMGSPRKDKPLISVNMAALSRDLIASELFGSARGSFTGSATDRKGRFEEAHGGTLFLDEIGDAPGDVQAYLLRALENRTVVRLGENIERKVDVRVVAATNRALAKDVQSGRFRQDLYYRLNVVCIDVPALRDRPEDIEPIAKHLLAGLAREKSFDSDAMRRLRQYAWPGNVRELRNVVERAVLLSDGRFISPADLRLDPASAESREFEEMIEQPFKPASEQFERKYFQRLLQRADSQKTKAAQLAGMNRSSIYNHLKKLGLAIPEGLAPDETGE